MVCPVGAYTQREGAAREAASVHLRPSITRTGIIVKHTVVADHLCYVKRR